MRIHYPSGHATVTSLAVGLAAFGLVACTTPKPQAPLPPPKPVTSTNVTCPALIGGGSNIVHEIASLPTPPTCLDFVDAENHHAFRYEAEGEMRISPGTYVRVVIWKTEGNLQDWFDAQVASILSGGHVRPFDSTIPVLYHGKRIEAAPFEVDRPNENVGNSCVVTDLQEQPGTQTRIVVCREVTRHAPDDQQWWTALQIAREDVPFIHGPIQIAH